MNSRQLPHSGVIWRISDGIFDLERIAKHGLPRNEAEFADALLARLRKELARPQVVKSARTIMTRLEFEAKPEWRASVRRRQHLVFILEGQGELTSKFYEYPDDYVSRDGFGSPLEVEMDESRLRHQLAHGQIELLSGAVPHLTKTND